LPTENVEQHSHTARIAQMIEDGELLGMARCLDLVTA
jgi:hypothetical protein